MTKEKETQDAVQKQTEQVVLLTQQKQEWEVSEQRLKEHINLVLAMLQKMRDSFDIKLVGDVVGQLVDLVEEAWEVDGELAATENDLAAKEAELGLWASQENSSITAAVADLRRAIEQQRKHLKGLVEKKENLPLTQEKLLTELRGAEQTHQRREDLVFDAEVELGKANSQIITL